MTSDKHEAERRRNKAINNWIRAGVSAPSMPLNPDDPMFALEPPAQQQPDPEAMQRRLAAAADAGAGTGGSHRPPPESMNDMLRDMLSSGPPGRRGR